MIKTKRYESPCGILLLGSYEDKLCLCDWQKEKHHDYVSRRLKRFLQTDFEEGTSDFQKTVWNELLKIPFGTTVSYGEMARRIGMPKAVRAVANANGANAISILAPCHRVIGSDHSLTGYGGGLDVKRTLLELEGVLCH